MKKYALFLLFLLLFLPGCIRQDYFRESVTRGYNLNITSEAECPKGECICMNCDVLIPEEPYSKFFKFSYASKTCQFTPCDQAKYLNYLRPPSTNYPIINYFMVGQGGFGEFNIANQFCNNSLRMPVKWLDSKNALGEYPLPDPSRATCFLEKGAIPVYILYSEGRNIDPQRAEEIAKLFKGKGPVIITTELEFDSSDVDVALNVSGQAMRMKAACPNCLIALAPRMGDYSDNLDVIVKDLGDYIDLFALGVNSQDFETCNPTVVYDAARTYSEYLLYKYKKPSVWVYILFDRAESLDGTCTWDDAALSRAYSEFYAYAPAFASSGVIGASLYSLYGIGSLECEDCGLFTPEGKPVLPLQPAWFANCQELYSTASVLPLLFSNASGTSCIYGPITYTYTGITFYGQPASREPAKAWPQFYSCDSCLVEERPESVGKFIRPQIPGDYVCSDYPVLDVYADIRDIDPAYVRATVWHESNFDHCSVGNSTAPCGRRKPIYYVSDPDAGCLWGSSDTYYAPRGSHVCDMGLIPTFATPEHTWDGIEWESFMTEAGGELDVARSCRSWDEEFNPFNPTHIACEGTYELANHIRTAEGYVESHSDELGLTRLSGDEYRNAKGLITVLMARIQFIGAKVFNEHKEEWADKFHEFSQITDSYCSNNPDSHVCCDGNRLRTDSAGVCCGSNADFVEFVTNEACMDLSGVRLGGYRTPVKNARAFLSKYLGVREKCGICTAENWEGNIEAWAAAQD